MRNREALISIVMVCYFLIFKIFLNFLLVFHCNFSYKTICYKFDKVFFIFNHLIFLIIHDTKIGFKEVRVLNFFNNFLFILRIKNKSNQCYIIFYKCKVFNKMTFMINGQSQNHECN